ncbi:GerAB/ArcD/ProY family transporter [Paenibacillus cremeus]|uniref:GerAB/ArcD/ProY family transporter n=1 Tax=Paenibacillus cremeus TaxID=2163881 RepID=A0A559KA57_9BACL|nr:GerAB/ArcD/ProY family transporter [Paenibacillus cremeus]TVY09006.1 GerAB/ArcD/ProY family transporter [Paenibacillus cremeus]
MNEERISLRQATIWCSMSYVGSAILIVPSKLAVSAGQDAWMAVILTVVVDVLTLPMFIAIVKQMNGRTVGQYLASLYGRWGGILILLIYAILYPYLNFVMAMRNIGDFLAGSILIKTPMPAVLMVYMIAVMLGMRWGLEALGRAAELLVPFVFILLLLFSFGLFSGLSVGPLAARACKRLQARPAGNG